MLRFIETDPDTMPLKKTMEHHYRDKYIKTIRKELNVHIQRKHWNVISIKNVPKIKRCISMVWAMIRKRNLVGESSRRKLDYAQENIGLSNMLTTGRQNLRLFLVKPSNLSSH